jgi:hypothetical protein
VKLSEEAARSADLLERLLTDAKFRAEFRKDPAGVARNFGVDNLADELASVQKSMQTLELRESRSGLAGVVMAAAVEVVGVVDLIQHLQADATRFTPDAAKVVGNLVSRTSLDAIKLAEAEQAHAHAHAPPFGGAEDDSGIQGMSVDREVRSGPGAQTFSVAKSQPPAEADVTPHSDAVEDQSHRRSGEVNASSVFAAVTTDSDPHGRPLDEAPAGIGGSIIPEGADIYPGDDAPPEQVAIWMGRRARQAGLPAELPVMASLVESRLRNLDHGDADSVGFFQMRLSIWNKGEYAGYPEDPEIQMQWFIDQALKVRQARLNQGKGDPAVAPAGWGEWIADIERPAEQFRHRYRLQLEEASRLVAQQHSHAHSGDVEWPAGNFAGEIDLAGLLDNPRLTLPARALADLKGGLVDQRLVAALARLTESHEIGLSVIKTGHSKFTSSGSVSNHFHGRGIDISMVDGVPVRPGSTAARDLVEKLLALPKPIRPTEVLSPFEMPGSSTDSAHQDHIHIAFDDPIDPDFELPQAQPDVHDHAEHIAPVIQRSSGVFAAAHSSGETAPGRTVEMPAVYGDIAEAATAGGEGGFDQLVPPIAPEELANTNAGGSLHGSEFGVPSPEGALGPTGRVHAGYDLFALGGSTVRAPSAGTVIEVKASRGSSGQLFGGTVKVQCDDGRVWVFRHVDPAPLNKGMRVPAGYEIATVTPWDDGPPHAHVELWKKLEGGYVITNMEDPLVELRRAYSRRR